MPKPSTPIKRLTDTFLRSRESHRAPGEFRDKTLPGLRLRVTETGHRTWVLIARLPGRRAGEPGYPSRYKLGTVYVRPEEEADEPEPEIRNGALTLAGARRKAREWLDALERGVNPKVEAAKRSAQARRKAANTWEAVVKTFLADYAAKLAKHAEAKGILEKEFGSRFAGRPITDIEPAEISEAIKAIAERGAVYQAYNAFGWTRSLYNWAIGTGLYGVNSSPTATLQAKKIIGEERAARDRVLKDDELRLVWEAAGSFGYPYGDLFRTLITTGQRKLEVGEMQWREIDLDKALWTIPAERMKSGRPHEVPLCGEALALLQRLDDERRHPKKRQPGERGTMWLWDKGDYVFSTTRGKTPVNGYSKAKARLDDAIAQRRAALRTGQPDAKPEKRDRIAPFVLHDLRRTMRTRISALAIEDIVRELMIAHAKAGLHKVYDQHAYLNEKAEGFRLWEAKLAAILQPPPPAEVERIDEARAKRSQGKR